MTKVPKTLTKRPRLTPMGKSIRAALRKQHGKSKIRTGKKK